MNGMTRSAYRLAAAVALIGWAMAASVATAATAPPETTAEWVRRAQANEDRLGEKFGVYVEDLTSGREVFAHQADVAMNPASVRKIVTMALALENLGPDYAFKTEFGLTAPVEPTRVHYHGDLLLRSDGNPAFGGPFMREPSNPFEIFDQWATGLRDAGVVYAHGDLVIDATAFGRDQNAYPEVWEPHHRRYSYAPVPSALAVAENLLQVTVTPGGSGDAGIVSVRPSEVGIRIDNETRTAGGSSGVNVEFGEDNASIRVTGRINRRGREVSQTPLPAPLQYIGANMTHALERAGVRLTGGIRVLLERPAGEPAVEMTRVIGSTHAPPLNRLLITMMRQSDNFLAEQIWFASAARVSGGTTNRLEARREEQKWYASKGWPWIEPGWDGNGLSRRDLATAHDTVRVLRHIFNSVYRDLLMESLPASGRQGTMRGRTFWHADGRVHAKTGTLAGVSALSGFILDKKRQPRLAFCIIGNAPGDTNGRLALRANELMKILLDDLDAGKFENR